MNKFLLFILLQLLLTSSSLCGTNYEFKYYYIVSDGSNLVTGPDVASQTNAVAVYAPGFWTANIPGAIWIWDSPYISDSTVEQTIIVTKDFTIPGIPATAFLDIAVDNYATVTINGKSIHGSNTFTGFSSAVHWDVQQYLTPGNNVIVIKATNTASLGSTDKTNPGGLKYKITVYALVATYSS